MKLSTPPDFPTEVFIQEKPEALLLPKGPWVLLGDGTVREAWRSAAMPEPEGTLWVSVDESHKRLETLLPWLEHWASLPLHRDGTVVAVGGGLLLDLAGFAASIYLRGIHWQAWPTTLLAQVDAGLGGKTGANLKAGKNLIGAFHAPQRLVVCTDFLQSLPLRQMESGRWELVKTALILGDGQWAEELLQKKLPTLAWIERALAFKAEVVHRDPREKDERRLLNLGHTLGHALEAASDYQLLHGEAVGLGLLAACFLAEFQGSKPFPTTLLQGMAQGLRPLSPWVAPWESCRPWLERDKKAQTIHGTTAIHCILPQAGSRALQRPLPVEAWAEPHARLLHFLKLKDETPRA